MTARFRAVTWASAPPVEKALDETDNKENHANAKATNSQDAENGQTGFGRIENRQHGSDHRHKPSADCSEDVHNGRNNTGIASSPGHEHEGIEKHRNTTFQKFIMHGLATTGALDKNRGKN